MKVIQRELAEAKKYLRISKLQVIQLKRDDAFTMFMFLYYGYEEQHNYLIQEYGIKSRN
jgi:hypothetical protein